MSNVFTLSTSSSPIFTEQLCRSLNNFMIYIYAWLINKYCLKVWSTHLGMNTYTLLLVNKQILPEGVEHTLRNEYLHTLLQVHTYVCLRTNIQQSVYNCTYVHMGMFFDASVSLKYSILCLNVYKIHPPIPHKLLFIKI